jgi:hypothetical protein
MYALKVTHPTFFKQSTNQALSLPPDQVIQVAEGTEYPISSFAPLRSNHIKFSLGKKDGVQLSINGRNTWIAFGGHVKLLKDGKDLDTPKPSINNMTARLKMTTTGKRDQFGADLYKLAFIKDGREVSSVTVISGQPGLKPVKLAQDQPGSMRPCPQGLYSLGDPEYGWWGEGLGRIWISVYGTDPYRNAIGIHEDANRWDGYPGSAGCICPLNETETRRVASWVEDGVRMLEVDYGL